MTAAARPSTSRHFVLVLRTLLRSLVTMVVVVSVYYLWPSREGTRLGVGFVVGIAGVIALVAWQVHSIARSHYPALRAIEALSLLAPLYVVLFAATYFAIGDRNASSFSQALTRTDALYFSMTVFSSVGFGDIVPVGTGARVAVMTQMFFDLVLLGFGVRVFVSAVDIGKQKKLEHPE